jgi:gluconolactonase
VSFKSHNPMFRSILGPSPSISLLAEDPNGLPMYHEACIYHQPTQSIIITSNQIPLPLDQSDESTSNKTIKISRVYDSSPAAFSTSVHVEDITPPSLVMANGGVNYGSGILICAQGNKSLTGTSGIVHIPDLSKPHTCISLISTFHYRAFNSVNDIIVHPHDGSIWFTDPWYGYKQGFRPKPVLPSHVYRFEPETGAIRTMADGFDRPNGLCFSPDCQTLYVTDTGAISGDQNRPLDPTGKSHIYAFDVVPSRSDVTQPFLTNRRLFAYASGLLPDGIKCDLAGNVYSGCGDGIEVWDASGVLLGTIEVKGVVANFCFGEKGTLYICNETRLWKARLTGEGVRGALLGI